MVVAAFLLGTPEKQPGFRPCLNQTGLKSSLFSKWVLFGLDVGSVPGLNKLSEGEVRREGPQAWAIPASRAPACRARCRQVPTQQSENLASVNAPPLKILEVHTLYVTLVAMRCDGCTARVFSLAARLLF